MSKYYDADFNGATLKQVGSLKIEFRLSFSIMDQPGREDLQMAIRREFNADVDVEETPIPHVYIIKVR